MQLLLLKKAKFCWIYKCTTQYSYTISTTNLKCFIFRQLLIISYYKATNKLVLYSTQNTRMRNLICQEIKYRRGTIHLKTHENASSYSSVHVSQGIEKRWSLSRKWGLFLNYAWNKDPDRLKSLKLYLFWNLKNIHVTNVYLFLIDNFFKTRKNLE